MQIGIDSFAAAYTDASLAVKAPDRLRELIDAKLEHRKPTVIEESEPASNVINLMDALKRSVRGAEGSKGGSEGKGKGNGRAAAKASKPRAKAGRKLRPRKAAA